MAKFSIRRVVIAVSLVVLLCASPWLIVFGMFGAMHLTQRVQTRSFDSARWKDPDRRDKHVYMIDSLLAHHELVGLSKSEVIDMLGEPDDEMSTELKFTYRLGRQRGSFFGIDHEWLTVEFDADGHVVKKKHWGD